MTPTEKAVEAARLIKAFCDADKAGDRKAAKLAGEQGKEFQDEQCHFKTREEMEEFMSELRKHFPPRTH